MTSRASAMYKIYTLLFLLIIFSIISKGVYATESKIIRTQFLEVSHADVDFKFMQFKTKWILSEQDWNNFLRDHNRITSKAPALPVNWDKEAVLSIFWKSMEDQVVRIPTFMGSDKMDDGLEKTLVLYFTLNTPCFGIITDSSPRQFLVFDHHLRDVDSVLIKTENTKSTGCY